MTILFWTVFFLILTHYLLFPLTVCLLAGIRSSPSPATAAKPAPVPTISLIIAAYNEEKVIRRKLENSLALDYPRAKLEIIVVSDGSTDHTHDIASSFQADGVIAIHEPARRGKTAALNRAVDFAHGEILLFSDANSFYRQDVPGLLARWFGVEEVGGVTGRKAIFAHGQRESSRGDRLFWDFESRLKTAESRLGSIPTGDGEIFAVRKSAFQRLDEKIINDDMAITLDLIMQGLRVAYEPRAVSEEQASLTLEEDFRVKARMVLGGFQILSRYRACFFPPSSLFAVQFLLHKTLRHLMPVLLLLLLGTNMALVARLPQGHFGYSFFLDLQLAFYGTALLGFFIRRAGMARVLYLPLYYCYMNLAALRGLSYFLFKADGVSIWKKAER